MTNEERLDALRIKLPPPPVPKAIYRPVAIAGGMAYVSGHGPLRDDGSYIIGMVGRQLTLEQGRRAAYVTGLSILATLRHELQSLNRVKRITKLFGMVNTAPDFFDHPTVIDGCSELYVSVFGEGAGLGARSAIGVGALPGNIAVEIEAIFEVE